MMSNDWCAFFLPVVAAFESCIEASTCEHHHHGTFHTMLFGLIGFAAKIRVSGLVEVDQAVLLLTPRSSDHPCLHASSPCSPVFSLLGIITVLSGKLR